MIKFHFNFFLIKQPCFRPKLYLLEQFPLKELGSSKIPKNNSILRLFFNHLFTQNDIKNNSNPKTLATTNAVLNAAKITVPEIKEVWHHHFGIKLIDGQEQTGGKVDEKK